MDGYRWQQGFTLVEVAIVLIIVGVLLGLGTGLLQPLTQRAKFTESRDIVRAAVESTTSWGAGNNRLPDTTTPVASPTNFSSIVRNPNDSWGRPLVYLYATSLAPAATTKDTICGRKSTPLTVTTVNPAATVNNVVFLILSSSDDYTVSSTSGGIPVASGPVAVATTITADTANDIVQWVTLDELRSKVGCQGPQLRIVNNELPAGAVSSAYSASLVADGGVPFAGNAFKWCLKGGLPAGVTTLAPTCPATPNCSALGGEGGTEWQQTGSLSISGTPTAAGTFSITILARDNNDGSAILNSDNCAEKNFVITVNP